MKKHYDYNDKKPIKIAVEDLTDQQRDLLLENKTFCMLPWIHLHAFPTGEAYPCCNTEMKDLVGNTNKQSLEEIWHGEAMQDVRRKMLAGEQVAGCTRCYEQEESGFFSMRLSSNKHFGHYIDRTDQGADPDMKIAYWDIRFSNLCNFKCRSCGTIFSSNWYDDQYKLTAEHEREEWKKTHKRINFAGRSEDDIWTQLEGQIDHLEQVYFAGGEPLIMEEHYRLLNALLDRGRTDVRLIYNTNFSEMRYKKSNVLDLWPHFKSVSVGASLDAMGPRAEYIRKGTDWRQVEDNRVEMLEKCPRVDFYVSATLSILNALHLPDFHQDWTERGFIKAQDFNVNILQDPPWYRIDMAKSGYKARIKSRYQQHLEWLQPQDHLQRATQGFVSAIKFMEEDDKTGLLGKFWRTTLALDKIRNEEAFAALPELKDLRDE
jgi:organic radical activating enzyme